MTTLEKPASQMQGQATTSSDNEREGEKERERERERESEDTRALLAAETMVPMSRFTGQKSLTMRSTLLN